MWSILENVPCALEKYVYSAALGWNTQKISIKCIWSSVSFKATVSLLIFCLVNLYWVQRGVKIPDYDLFLSLPLCPSRFALHIYVLLCWVHKCLLALDLLVGLFPLLLCSVFTFWLLLCFFHVSLLNQSAVKWISCWTNQAQIKFHSVGQSNSFGWGYCFLSGWCPLERSAQPERDGFCSMT